VALPEVMTVQGRVVDSKEEYWVSRSLLKYGWNFGYQVAFFGGWQTSGGFVVDFIVETVPLPTPLWVNGEYWHSGAQAERDRLNQLLLQSRVKGYLEAKTVWGEDLTDQDETDKTILRLFGRR
jgi:hypothetical protein